TLLGDLLAVRPDGVPLGAEFLLALTFRHAGLLVVVVVVERVPAVGDLHLPVAALAGGEERTIQAGPGLRLAGGGERSPHRRALPVALAGRPLVLQEPVDGVRVRAHKDLAERDLAQRHLDALRWSRGRW